MKDSVVKTVWRNMTFSIQKIDQNSALNRRTTSDDVFDEIYSQISSMKIPPGVKLSEVEIARQFDVSRQPVREAFIRLADMGLLLIRPQRATVVKRISLREMATARFVRRCIEIEVFRRACAKFKASDEGFFRKNLKEQKDVIESNDLTEFGNLDEAFHKQFCIVAEMPDIFGAIKEQKSKVDRLCMLSFADRQECVDVYSDHVELVEHLAKQNEASLIAKLRDHLSRLDATIERVSSSEPHLFED